MIFIRVDGNSEIGTGHMMRCLAIAEEARGIGENCVFITADQSMSDLINRHGFEYICLNSVWNDLDKETSRMETLILKENIHVLLVDSYFVTTDYLYRLNKITHVAYIDDLNELIYPSRILINPNVYADKFDYLGRYRNTRLFLGTKYTPLRSEFQQLPCHEINQQVKNVMVTAGGIDAFNVAGRFVGAAKQHPDVAGLVYHIVSGRFNKHQDMLEKLAQTYPGVVIYKNVQRMSELMMSCDIAVSAGGTTLYELSACGIPTICFAWTDNQLDNAAGFGEDKDLMINIGDVRTFMPQMEEKMMDAVMMLSNDYDRRADCSKRLQQVVDGKGAERIVRILLQA